MVVYGTRPEGIKVAPLIRALKTDSRFEVVAVGTGQHRGMLDEVDELFGIRRDFDLGVFEAGQSLNRLSARVMKRLDCIFDREPPDVLVVQGDTSSALAAALAAFNRQVPVVHVEAGLRSGDLSAPFPEEGNRRMIAQIASLHLAPTANAKKNLIAEGAAPDRIRVTGNTVVDALETMLADADGRGNPELAPLLESGRRIVTVTAHRRENWGEPLKSIGRALRRLSSQFEDVRFVLPLHANPAVGEVLAEHLGGRANVTILPPLDYIDFLRLVKGSVLVVSDSGGVQEEVPSLRTPLLVLRRSTERPEIVESGWARIIGTDEDAVHDAIADLLTSPDGATMRAKPGNPFGDGRASRRSIAAIAHFLGRGERLPDYGEEGR
ncbi:non-hydrolyzing UDP-N-acetylglucosamine 2-epimerase [Schaalia hyovaginalis]|uniref:non-hydrolyzing UDP-N-acetylglucosamine 2-epimerase n=1 Tax=Schaalia hyovaginalis TaxID=29316 RepID=UPI002A8093D2|nr:UDP-N-acetylglucosamine 2-epimerase (non-hydrolyzing) [Schaalia hyovaginalis]MDY3665756.1 UDP-N-acetylglucosamine 2-epimerase (non-hydrolyzing) [Schaalia hyovaginalis]